MQRRRGRRKRGGGASKREREKGRIDGWVEGGKDRRPTERIDKALTPLPGCILAGRQLWIGNITAAGN